MILPVFRKLRLGIYVLLFTFTFSFTLKNVTHVHYEGFDTANCYFCLFFDQQEHYLPALESTSFENQFYATVKVAVATVFVSKPLRIKQPRASPTLNFNQKH